jgi:hypothetical protein
MTNTVAPLTTIVFAAPGKNGDADAPKMYRLRKGFAVVQFEADQKGRIVFLPEGAELDVVGPSTLRKCFEVVSKNQRYNIFQEDLLGPWSIQIKHNRGGLPRAKALGVCA